MERMLKFLALAGFSALCVLPAKTALADSDDSHKPPHRCATKQHDEATEGSSSLKDCGGVLEPPSVGDAEMVNKPPKVETMPTIKPGDLGQQDSK
ncbi:hypothetical protein [Rhizobium ecuadorense]|uniref:hypothetical protein n=1 Tax=Rhizobium ecuadorense TaxID=1671795 RepID=UPI000673C423|nr:hypothetical protein [Rhizobium ecuadorense]